MQSVLKILVILLGVMILMGLGMLGYGFIKTAEDPNWRLFGAAPVTSDAPAEPEPVIAPTVVVPSPPATSSAAPISTTTLSVSLGLPLGCRIEGVSDLLGRIAVRTAPREAGGTCGSVFLIDPATGSRLGTIEP